MTGGYTLPQVNKDTLLMYQVGRNKNGGFLVSEINHPKLETFNPVSLEDLKKKNPMELLFTAEAIDYLNNYLFLTIVDGEWRENNVEPFY
jgi:hypothetical protein